jgi:hypothetical protein
MGWFLPTFRAFDKSRLLAYNPANLRTGARVNPVAFGSHNFLDLFHQAFLPG